jgi:hypothetical protein
MKREEEKRNCRGSSDRYAFHQETENPTCFEGSQSVPIHPFMRHIRTNVKRCEVMD